MYAAEWPCCHDPLRFRLGFDDLLPSRNNPLSSNRRARLSRNALRSSSRPQVRIILSSRPTRAARASLPSLPHSGGKVAARARSLRLFPHTPHASSPHARHTRIPISPSHDRTLSLSARIRPLHLHASLACDATHFHASLTCDATHSLQVSPLSHNATLRKSLVHAHMHLQRSLTHGCILTHTCISSRATQ